MHTSTGAPRGLESSKSNGLLENVNDTGDNNDDALGESSLGHSVCESSCQSMADTFVGTYTYMSPERIGGLPYGYAADVWSLGLSLLTLILGVFPYESAAQIKGYWGLLHDITTLPSPELPPNDHESDRMGDDNESTEAAGHHQTQPIGSKSRSRKGCYYPPELRDFLAKCLAKDPSQRPSVRDLLQHPLVRGCTLEDGDNNKASARGLEGEQEDKHDVGGSSGSSNSVSDGNGGSGINLESETALLELDHVCHGLRSYYRNKWAKQASEGQLPDVPNFQRDRVASLAQQVGVLEATARLKFAALAHPLRQDAAAIFSEEKPADSCDGCE
jgi:serine/threonine protein kinase